MIGRRWGFLRVYASSRKGWPVVGEDFVAVVSDGRAGDVVRSRPVASRSKRAAVGARWKACQVDLVAEVSPTASGYAREHVCGLVAAKRLWRPISMQGPSGHQQENGGTGAVRGAGGGPEVDQEPNQAVSRIHNGQAEIPGRMQGK